MEEFSAGPRAAPARRYRPPNVVHSEPITARNLEPAEPAITTSIHLHRVTLAGTDAELTQPYRIPAMPRLAAGPLHSNLAALQFTLTPEQFTALDEPSTPSLDLAAAITAGPGPILGFGGATVDDVELPVWPMLLTSPTRY